MDTTFQFFSLQQVPFARASLNHDDIFILDTKSKIFQFSGSNSSIQERAKALEVVQHLKDTNHDGKCDVAAVGKLILAKRVYTSLNRQGPIFFQNYN